MTYKAILKIAQALEAISIWAIGYPVLHHLGFCTWEMISILFGVAFLYPSRYSRYS